MTAEDFAAWVDAMRAARGWTGRECARQLGCDKNQIGTWSERGAPIYIALACAALAHGLPSWRKAKKAVYRVEGKTYRIVDEAGERLIEAEDLPKPKDSK